MQTKTFSAAGVKALDKPAGILEAIVSVFDNVDAAGERVKPGFFAKSLANKLPKGVWMHDWTQPVAKTLEAKELLPGDPLLPDVLKNNGGLYVKAQFNLETERGRDAFSDIAFGLIDEFSFGFDVDQEKKAADGVTDLLEGRIYEWSPVLYGCNPATMPISAKRLSGAPGFKGLLSSYLPASMSMAAMGRAQDALYWLIYDVLYGYGEWSEKSVEQKIAAVEEALAEFSALVVPVIRAVLTGTAEESVTDAAALVKGLWHTLHPRLKALEIAPAGEAPDALLRDPSPLNTPSDGDRAGRFTPKQASPEAVRLACAQHLRRQIERLGVVLAS